jgi:hypothetical protein
MDLHLHDLEPGLGGRCSTISSSVGLRRPEFLIVDGAPGLENAIAAVWDGVPVQRCTVHKHRNLLAHARVQFRSLAALDQKQESEGASGEAGS